ncbi:MAG: HipA domain-containing protein [Burkholderiaceae bacterium]|jgi:serine/threonine-protein kinase HipA|nr:HipA domain-containing protein [Burkholderiaceae bacterium]
MSEPGTIRYLRMYLHAPDGGRVPIGYLSSYGDIMRVSFDEDYINNPQRLSLSLTYRGADEAQTRAILQARHDGRVATNTGRWPPFFQNLLPEGINRKRLAAQRGCSVDDEFELLAAAGHDLMGALEVEPTPPREEIPQSVRHWHSALGFDVLEPGFVEMPVEDGSALPGAVTKFSAVVDGRRYVVRRHGHAGSHILKLPSTVHEDLAFNEFAGYALCDSLGLQCASAQLITREEAELPEHVPFEFILAVQRFDRVGERRVHMEEFAQAMGLEPARKYGKDIIADYGQMLRVIDQQSARPAKDVQEFLGRLVAFILMGNADAHLKNWALIYEDGITPALAPLYDPVSVASYFEDAPAGDYVLNRAIDKRVCEFTWDDMRHLIEIAGLARPSALIKHCRDLVSKAKADWPGVMADYSAPPPMVREITRRLAGKVALAA